MSNLKVNTINDANGGSAAVLYGVASPPNSMGFRNRIINGDMRIDQRNAGASVTPAAAGSGAYTLDRWNNYASQASKYTVQQNSGSVTPPAGFSNYIGVVSSSAYSITATDIFLLRQLVEGYNVADFGWGAASAQAVTLSFWVRSSLTGTFGGSFQNAAQDRNYPFSYTIIAANTWEQKTVTIPGDTTGTWLKTNGVGVQVNFSLGVGSTYSGTANAWASGGPFWSATGATSVVGTSGATFYITGVQLEAGTVASPFERRDYGRELMMCQRYYYRQAVTGSFSHLGTLASAVTATIARGAVILPVSMRVAPTSVESANVALDDGSSVTNTTSVTVFANNSPERVTLNYNVSSGLTVFRPYMPCASSAGSAFFGFPAEL